ncbi:Surface antigen [Flavobacterium fluvii]|uniref:Surface antigen n=1 Tax=Flavobacterium fluvii TaxID=468056 RepID=A0A1M5IE45_9FLAO|nr:BamA/TamA family outer membrane protein [Flavobacterium fluvii]SHG26546.1 Surface antigen [Flavobacterium fluvii]
MKNKLLFILLLLFVVLEVKAQDKDTYFITANNDTIIQKDGIDYLIQLFKINKSQEKIQNKKVNFSFFPTDARNAGERVLVSSFNATFLLGDKSNTNNSTVYFIPYISFKKQYGVELYPTVWLKKNSWNFVGEYFALNFPQDTWGLGGNTPKSNETLVDGKQIRFHQNVLKGIFPNLAVGIGYQFDEHYELEIDNADNPDFPDTGTQKSISSGLSVPIVYDNRKNIINPQKGFYSSFTYLFNDPALGSDNKWQSIFVDVRKYFSIPYARSVLGFRSYYWTILSGKVPYFDLPSTRTEPSTGMTSRGIQKNRYRSNAMLFFESEYRFNITPNGFVGGVLFANTTSASEYETQHFKHWQPSIGTGIRLKFNKYTKVNVAFDFGISKDYASVYLNIGEAF